MKPTRITSLVIAATFVSIAGFFVIQQLVGNGLPAPLTGLNIVVIQPSLALILLLSAIPMIRYRRALKKFEDGKGKRPALVDSNYAVRTLALAKAVSITGSILLGWQLAILFYQLVSPEATKLVLTVLAVAGGLIMAMVGLIVENLFRIPPDRDGDAA